MTIGFWQLATGDPHRLALVEPDGREVTFGDLLGASNRTANGLRAIGLTEGDNVSVVLHNVTAFLEIYLAAMQIGLYVTPINFHLTGPEIAYIANDAEARAIVVSERFAAAVSAAAPQLDVPEQARFSLGTIPGFRAYRELTAGQSEGPPAGRVSGQTMLYTSGTTGRPKGVRRQLSGLDPDQAAGAASTLSGLFGVRPGPGVHLVAGPLYHAAPLGFGTGALHMGQTLVIMDKWTPGETLALIDRWGVTSSHMVPTMFHRLLALPEEVKSGYDHSSLISVVHAAAPCPVDVKRRMIEWWGPVIYEYYAATEGGGTFVDSSEWLAHPGTVGRPWPGSTIKILDDDGNEVAPGVSGTVYMGSQRGDFGYFKDDAKTQGSRLGELFTVGDIGYLTADGWLFLNDRKADMIISGGVNIYPAEIEAVLLAHPAVGDAAVLGVPDEEWGEQVKAVIEPARGVEASEALADELLAHCRERLASFKVPRSVDFRDELPRYPTGKLYKRVLRDDYWKGHERAI